VQADACFNKLLDEQPDYLNGQYAHAYVYLQRGMHQEAAKLFERVYETNKSLGGAGLGYTYGVMGRRAEALKVLDDMLNLSRQPNTYVPSQEIAMIYLGLGDLDNAFVWLNKAADERFAPFAYLAIDPMFKNLHSDTRFIELVHRLHLPPSNPST